jgi:hypothetical protein
MTWKEAIVKVLEEANEPLHYREITEEILSRGMKKSVGATPSATVNALITSSLKNEKEKSRFVRVSKGVFSLKEKLNSEYFGSSKTDSQDLDEDESEIIQAFGMFWKRSDVLWRRTPKLLGIESLGADPVDFSEQRGIYLLYDGREVVYVGRSTDRPLGRRLYEHTIDRLSGRWDRFSWFGFRPVSETGLLGEIREMYNSELIISMLEAVLIEAIEPRQNRRRGDDLEGVEYLQARDPEIEKKRLKTMIDKL